MRNYKQNQFSINLMILLRDKMTLKDCIEMRKKFNEEPKLLDEDSMEIIFTELELAIKNKKSCLN